MAKTFSMAPASSRGRRVAEANDVAARYLVYKIYDAIRESLNASQALGGLGEPKAIVDRAIERGWLSVREDGEGKTKVRTLSLTDEGRRLAAKSWR